MSEIKPSGIRPPSKIDRPTCTVIPKPALPPRSINSMEPLWETHGRRLSEAGVRRGSDNSVILTEDTDSFIIGDHVWVGGSKPGQIAYIGETQFAPGDWAGIVLDEPIGKNDGSVAGFRYFQCEPKRGIFSRLTRLTRHPISAGVSSPTSPIDVKGTFNKSISPSLNTSTTSLSSVSQREVQLGERVIVSSSQGSKTGVLKYLGTTEFAPGEWCGVELDEALGKNDGSVNDKRYFECRPKYGLFAPVHKVSRSPLNKRSMCVVRRPTGAALNMSLRKISSRESLASVNSVASAATSVASRATTAASNTTSRLHKAVLTHTTTPVRKTTQDTLKDRHKEIEVLRTERDLERQRFTEAANQVEEAEKVLVVLKKEYEKFREDTEKLAQDSQKNLAELLEEKNLLVTQLEEERRKCEDLLFRFEEESINKDDIQKENSEQSVANSIYENKIKDLEKQLSEERERVIQLERDSTKLFETEEELTKLRIEVQNATAEEINEFSNLQKRYNDLEQANMKIKNLLEEKTETVEKYTIEISEINEKLKETEEKILIQEKYKSNLHKQLEETTKQLQEKCVHNDELKNEFKIQTENLQKEIHQLKETIQNISDHNVTEKIKLIEVHEKILKENQEIIKTQDLALKFECERLSSAQNEVLQKLKVEKDRQIEELSKSSKSIINSRDTQIEEISNQLEKKIKEVNSLSIELNTLNAKHMEEIKIITEKKSTLENNVASLIAEVNTLKDQLNKLDECIQMKDLELSRIQMSKIKEIENIQQFHKRMENKNKCIQDITDTASQKSLKLNLIEKELADLKSIIINKDEEIKNLSEKASELQDVLTFSEQTISNLESELHFYENQFIEINEKYKISEEKIIQLSNEKEKLKAEISRIVSTSMDSSEKFIMYNEQLREKEKELDEARNKEFELRQSVIALESKANIAEQDAIKTALSISELQLKNKKIESYFTLEKKERQSIEEKFALSLTMKQELIDKNKSLEEDLNSRILELSDLTNSIKSIKETNIHLEKELSNASEEHKTKKFQLEKQISEGGNDQIILKENIDTLEKLNAQLLNDHQAMDLSMREVKEKLNAKNQHVLQLESLVNNKDLQLTEVMKKLEHSKREKEEIKKNLLEMNIKHNDTVAELALLKSSNTNLESQMTLEVANLKQQLEDEKNTLDTALKESKNYLDELTKELSTVSETCAKSNQRCSEMENIISTKDREIKILSEKLTSEKENNETAKQKLQVLEESIATKSNEIISNVVYITSLNEKIKTLEAGINIFKTDLENKTKVITELENIIDVTKKSNEDKYSCNILEKQKKIDELMKKHEQELNYKDSIISEFKYELENKKKIVHEFSEKKMNLEDLIIKYERDLNFKDKTIDDLKNVEKIAKETIKDYKEKQKCIDDLIIKHEDDIKLKDKIILELQQTKIEMKERIENFIEQINYAHETFSNLEESHRCMEQDNKQLLINYNEIVAKLNITNENFKNSTNTDILKHEVENQKTQENSKPIISTSGSEFEKLKEEYDMAKSQIEFLNSVIVDMRHKNETMLCKIQVLEMGIPAQEADDYNLNLLQKKMQPPRMFCDICDQFDLHETEDCPQQAQDPVPIKSKTEKKQPMQRPYCENCEMFGHDTHACEETETY